DWDRDAYRGQVDVRRTPHDSRPKDPNVLTGRVFVDADRDSRRHPSEKGLAGVRVSNGEDVVLTDKHGRYELPVRDNMTVFVTQ
ncbi:UNVERIFIED_CONTAM: metallophosphoesterase N-terminal domain-containing protein, partial [Pseudomonas aeruginosa]